MTASGVTVGVEEEFLLTDANGTPVSRARAVLDCVASCSAGEIKPELQPVQVEASTPPRTTLAELRADLNGARATLAEAAGACAVSILAVGAPVRREGPVEVATPAQRHVRVHERYAGLVREYDACGVHVHIGVPDRELAVAVTNHLRPWLPTLLALGANSPFHEGRDTGYSSWRAVEQSRFPGWGLPPFAASARELDGLVARLVEAGTLVDERQSFWLARPSPRFPTVEVRASDVGLRTSHSLLQAALTRGLVRAAVRDLGAGVEGPHIDQQIGAAAVWTAARYGISGPALDPVGGVLVPFGQLLDALLARIADDLDELGDRAETIALLAEVVGDGGGAGLQRTAGVDGVVQRYAVTPDRARN